MFAPSDALLKALLENVRTIAVLGAKDRPGQPVDLVGRYLIARGFTVHPVHPKRENVWGRPTYRTLAEVPGAIDLVDVFRVPESCPEHAREVLALPVRPKVFWMQSGISSPEARDILEGSGLAVVENLCLMVEHRRLF
jgi:predicted CoA-binding protein